MTAQPNMYSKKNYINSLVFCKNLYFYMLQLFVT